MKRRTIKYLCFTLSLIALGALFIYAVFDKTGIDQVYRNLFSHDYRVFAPEPPPKMDFAGEKVPLKLFYVREALDREILASTFMHASTILMFKRSYRWFPVIEPILKKNGIPDDFKFLALAESNFANVVSPAGAEGFWQFIKPTGQKYGLEITEEVDERYNVEKSTEAACRYFREAWQKFGSWTLAAASYNRGIDGMSDALVNQGGTGFYDLFMNDETGRYIYRILAMKEVYNHPVKYGFYLREQDFYPPVPSYTVMVDTPVQSLPAFAQKLKTSYKVLRDFNPWIRRYNLPNKSRKSYTFILPLPGMIYTDSLYRGGHESSTFFNDTLKINQLR
jgi:membrane-bound lytic murein transglycosylase D